LDAAGYQNCQVFTEEQSDTADYYGFTRPDASGFAIYHTTNDCTGSETSYSDCANAWD
jgi:predicted lipoprotein with Yx(FWY)xxD motif